MKKEKLGLYHFSIVVLHYLTAQDTMECVESILKNILYEDLSIIVVDNGSPNDSGQSLYQMYLDNPRVEVILLKDNLGYARGNNVGYSIAKYQYDADFIIFTNNDTIIYQHDFIQRIIEKFTYYQFDIMGPDIISLVDGGHQNPVRLQGMSKKELVVWIIHISLLLLLNYLGLEKIIRKVQRGLIGQRTRKETPFNEDLRDVQLHGSCLVFSPKYVSAFDGICSKTFMYMEEDILYFQVKSKGLLNIYTPDVVIYHKEDSSTKATFDEEYKRRRFQYKNVLASSRILLAMMNDHTEGKSRKSE